MAIAEFQFLAPESVEEVVELLAEYGDRARLLAGGMSLVPIMNLGLADLEFIVSLNHLSEPADIIETDEHIRIGAMVRHNDIVKSSVIARDVAALSQAASKIGDVQVRNRGTMGGSIAHADPAADYTTVLAAYDAMIIVRSVAGERRIPIRDFALGFMETQLSPDELITAVEIPKGSAVRRSSYVRLARVEGSFSIVNAAALVGTDEVIIALGAVRSTPVVISSRALGLIDTEEALTGWVSTAIAEALAAQGSPPSELAAYKEAMAATCGRRAAIAALRSLRSET